MTEILFEGMDSKMNSYSNNFTPGRETAGEACRIQSPIMVRAAAQELSDDFSLPDYKPEIRRMISVTASASPAAHYLTPGHAEFAGAVKYCIRYEGADGGVWSAELPSEYDVDLAVDNDPSFESEGAVACADAVCESVSARVTAPRRVSIRARIRVDAAMFGRRRLEESISGASALPEGDIKKHMSAAETALILRERTEPAEYSDTFLPDDGGTGEVRVISCRAEPFVSEAGISPEGVCVRGELAAAVLLCRDAEGARPFCVSRRIPFSEIVGFDSVPAHAAGCRAWGGVTSAKAEPDENGGIACSFEAAFTAEILASESVAYTSDIYSSSCVCAVTTRQTDAAAAIKSFNTNLTVSGGCELAALGVDSGVRVVDAHAEAVPTAGDKNSEADRFAISGKLRVRVLLDDGAQTVGKDFEIPFKYEPDLPGGVSPAVGGGYSEWMLTVPVCRVRIDGEKLSADCELAIAARLCGKQKLISVAEARVGEPRAERYGNIAVYYPTPDDTLWSVAKRYGADAGELAAANGIDAARAEDEKLTGVRFIMV